MAQHPYLTPMVNMLSRCFPCSQPVNMIRPGKRWKHTHKYIDTHTYVYIHTHTRMYTYRLKEKRMAEDGIVRQYHRFNGHEFEQTLGDNGQGSLVCCSPWGGKESDVT